MRASIYLWGCFTLGFVSNALPVSRREGAVPRSETVDGDDQVVYTWSLPDEKDKRGESTDGDDKVVYTWSLPDEKKKRTESGDGDDQVVYTWSLPEE